MTVPLLCSTATLFLSAREAGEVKALRNTVEPFPGMGGFPY